MIEAKDTAARFILTNSDIPVAEQESRLLTLCESWDRINQRQHVDDSAWHADLTKFLTHLVNLRVAHVKSWIESNIQRFTGDHASIEELRRTFDNAIIDLRASVELCRRQCDSCSLLCLRSSRSHGDGHDCVSNHECIHDCTFCERDGLPKSPCGERSVRPHSSLVFLTYHASLVLVTPEITCEPGIYHTCPDQNSHAPRGRCQVGVHRCGERCEHFGKRGCAEKCIQVITPISNYYRPHVLIRCYSRDSPLANWARRQSHMLCSRPYVWPSGFNFGLLFNVFNVILAVSFDWFEAATRKAIQMSWELSGPDVS